MIDYQRAFIFENTSRRKFCPPKRFQKMFETWVFLRHANFREDLRVVIHQKSNTY